MHPQSPSIDAVWVKPPWSIQDVLRAIVRTIDTHIPWLTRSSPKSFLLGIVATFAIGATGMFSFCWFVNPWGNHGATGYHVLGDARSAKTLFLDSLPKADLPQAVVLGSSQVMRFRPATIEDRLGVSAFNYGAYWTKAEDLLCMVRHLVYDLDHRPELLIIGLDTWTIGPPADDPSWVLSFNAELFGYAKKLKRVAVELSNEFREHLGESPLDVELFLPGGDQSQQVGPAKAETNTITPTMPKP